jgi:uncharacterized membrane protein (UPF0127 family)
MSNRIPVWKKFSTIFILSLLSHSPAMSAQPAHLLKDFSQTKLVIITNDRCILFDVYIAQTPTQRSQGLMHIESMEEQEGMIFLHNENKPVYMWMKNTLISLDMLFVDATGSIASLHRGAVPHSEEIIESGLAVIAVIELNAGAIEHFNIGTGNQIIIPAN